MYRHIISRCLTANELPEVVSGSQEGTRRSPAAEVAANGPSGPKHARQHDWSCHNSPVEYCHPNPSSSTALSMMRFGQGHDQRPRSMIMKDLSVRPTDLACRYGQVNETDWIHRGATMLWPPGKGYGHPIGANNIWKAFHLPWSRPEAQAGGCQP